MAFPTSRVVGWIEHRLDHLLSLTYGGQTLQTTVDHPFYSVDRRCFVRASELFPGERLLNGRGQGVPVERLKITWGDLLVYNLEVEKTHCYFAGGVLVHNCTLIQAAVVLVGAVCAAAAKACVAELGAVAATGAAAVGSGGCACHGLPAVTHAAATTCTGALVTCSTFVGSNDLAQVVCSTGSSDKEAAGEKISSKDIKEAGQSLNCNKDFRRWFHREYKADQGKPKGDRHNPDMSPEEVYDAYKEWQDSGKPKR